MLEANPDVPVIEVEVHAGYHNNTKGVLFALESTRCGIIDRKNSSARIPPYKSYRSGKEVWGCKQEYLAPSRGDVKYKVAKRVIELLKEVRKGLVIMNAKKDRLHVCGHHPCGQ